MPVDNVSQQTRRIVFPRPNLEAVRAVVQICHAVDFRPRLLDHASASLGYICELPPIPKDMGTNDAGQLRDCESGFVAVRRDPECGYDADRRGDSAACAHSTEHIATGEVRAGYRVRCVHSRDRGGVYAVLLVSEGG